MITLHSHPEVMQREHPFLEHPFGSVQPDADKRCITMARSAEFAMTVVNPRYLTLAQLREYPPAHAHQLIDPLNTLVLLTADVTSAVTRNNLQPDILAYMIVRGISVQSSGSRCLTWRDQPLRRKLKIPGIQICGRGFPGFNMTLDGMTNRRLDRLLQSEVAKAYLPTMLLNDLGCDKEAGPDMGYTTLPEALLWWWFSTVVRMTHRSRRFVERGAGIGGPTTVISYDQRVPPSVKPLSSDVLRIPAGHLRSKELSHSSAVHQHQTFNRILNRHFTFEATNAQIGPLLTGSPYMILK